MILKTDIWAISVVRSNAVSLNSDNKAANKIALDYFFVFSTGERNGNNVFNFYGGPENEAWGLWDPC